MGLIEPMLNILNVAELKGSMEVLILIRFPASYFYKIPTNLTISPYSDTRG